MKKSKISKACSYLFCSTAILSSLLFIDHKEVKADTTSSAKETTDSQVKQALVTNSLDLNKVADKQTESSISGDNAQVANNSEQIDTGNTNNSSNKSMAVVTNNPINADATEDTNTVNSIWGTSPVTFDKSTGALTVYSGHIYAQDDVDNNNLIKKSDVKTILITGTVIADDGKRLFSSFVNTTSINGIDNLDISKIINMDSMFSDCDLLTELNISNWDTSNVTSMASMFRRTGLTSLDVSKWDTSNVTSMEAMFRETEVTSLDVSKWDTSNVTSMKDMFVGTKLNMLDLNNWDTSNVTDMANMFDQSSKLTSLNISNWDTSNVYGMATMFRYCTNLVKLNLGNWNISKVTFMQSMFLGCRNLVSLDINSWNTNGKIITDMLSECPKLSKIILGSQTIFTPGKYSKSVSLPSISTETKDFTGRWIKITDNLEYFPDLNLKYTPVSVYADSSEFTDNYDGSNPGIYTWERYAVITRYVDENGNEISPTTIQTGKLDENYTSKPADITDYTLKAQPTNASGKYNNNTPTEVVTYVYSKDDNPVTPPVNPVVISRVTARYVDENGNEIFDKVVFTGKSGESYKTIQRSIEGYTFEKTTGAPTSGFFGDTDKEVTYVYKKDKVTPTPENPENPEKPSKPEEPVNPDNPSRPDNNTPSNKPGTSSNNSSTNQFNEGSNPPKNVTDKVENTLPQAGSENNVLTIILGIITSVLAVLGISFKKKNN